MKKGRFFVLGMLALGLALSGCDTGGSGGSSDLDGVWHRIGDGRVYSIITASDGNFTKSVDMNAASSPTRNYIVEFKGTYAKDAKSPVTITLTSYNNYNGTDNWVGPEFPTSVATIIGDKLTITNVYTTATYTKQ